MVDISLFVGSYSVQSHHNGFNSLHPHFGTHHGRSKRLLAHSFLRSERRFPLPVASTTYTQTYSCCKSQTWCYRLHSRQHRRVVCAVLMASNARRSHPRTLKEHSHPSAAVQCVLILGFILNRPPSEAHRV